MAAEEAPAMDMMIGGVEVSAEDWEYVEQYCMTLDEEGVEDSATEEPEIPAELTTTTIELDTLTYQDCVDAGLIDGAVDAGGGMITEGGAMDSEIQDDGLEETDEDEQPQQ